MIKKNWFKNLPLILLAAAIALSPSFSAGQIEGGRIVEIRAEDILIVILGLVWLANFLISGRKKVEKPPLLLPILAWLGVGFFSLLTNWIFANITFSRGFFYFLKEIEFFFLYFYLFYHIKNLDSAKFLIKIWIFLGLVNISWIIYETITNLKLTFFYGPTAFSEPEGSSPSGGFSLIIFIFLLNVLIFYYLTLKISKLQKIILSIVILFLGLGVFTSGSRGAFGGVIFALFITFLLYFLKKKSVKSFLVSVPVIIFLCLVFIYSFLTFSGVKRLTNIQGIFREFSQEEGSRLNIWRDRILLVSENPAFVLFGLGKSSSDESHSHYVRNFVETGIIGSLIFFILIFVILRKSWRGFLAKNNSLLIGLSSGLLVATFAMLVLSIGNDAFIVVKINEVYWFFAGLTMAVLTIIKKQESSQV